MPKIYKAIMWRSRESAKPLEVTFTGDEVEAENAAHAYFTKEAEAFYFAELISFESAPCPYLRTPISPTCHI